MPQSGGDELRRFDARRSGLEALDAAASAIRAMEAVTLELEHIPRDLRIVALPERGDACGDDPEEAHS